MISVHCTPLRLQARLTHASKTYRTFYSSHLLQREKKMAACIPVIACFVILGRLHNLIIAASQEKNLWRIWVARVGLLGCDIARSCTSLPTFWEFLPNPVFSYKVDKTYLSGISVNFYQTTRRHLPEDCGLYIRHCEVVFWKNEYSAIKHAPIGFRD
jgi:hypothetical protein